LEILQKIKLFWRFCKKLKTFADFCRISKSPKNHKLRNFGDFAKNQTILEILQKIKILWRFLYKNNTIQNLQITHKGKIFLKNGPERCLKM